MLWNTDRSRDGSPLEALPCCRACALADSRLPLDDPLKSPSCLWSARVDGSDVVEYRTVPGRSLSTVSDVWLQLIRGHGQ